MSSGSLPSSDNDNAHQIGRCVQYPRLPINCRTILKPPPHSGVNLQWGRFVCLVWGGLKIVHATEPCTSPRFTSATLYQPRQQSFRSHRYHLFGQIDQNSPLNPPLVKVCACGTRNWPRTRCKHSQQTKRCKWKLLRTLFKTNAWRNILSVCVYVSDCVTIYHALLLTTAEAKY